jgi:hypothetical protein
MSDTQTEYKITVQDSGDPGYVNRILIATPTTGLVRIEWVQSRYGQIIPVNWSNVLINEFMEGGYYPLRYQVDDAQNMVCKVVVEKNFEWLLLVEHDTCMPPDAFIRFNQYMREKSAPVVSGLYFTRSVPSEPLIFRGRGNSFYANWKLGDVVECDGVPTGCLLVHGDLIRAMWNESEEYSVRGTITRRVFNTPRKVWFDPENNVANTTSGTSDLDWCDRVMKGGYFEKSGWKEWQEKKYPFICDTNIFCRHIDQDGRSYP